MNETTKTLKEKQNEAMENDLCDFLEMEPTEGQIRQEHHSKRIRWGNVTFNSVREAMRTLHVSGVTLYKSIRDGKQLKGKIATYA